MRHQTAFVLLPRGTPTKSVVKILHDQDINSVVYRSYDIGKAKQLIKECDFVTFWQCSIDDYVRTLLEWARSEGIHTLSVEWFRKNLSK